MAVKDIGRGWGDLPSWLDKWYCPLCLKDAPVADWQIVMVRVGANTLDGRSCPNCKWTASQTGETNSMLETDKHAMKVIEDRDKPKKEKEKIK